MANADESGMAPIRRDQVVASDLIAMRELLKAEAQAIHQLAQTAIIGLDAKSAARFVALDEKMEALHHAQSERLEALNVALEEKLSALNKSGWERLKDMDAAARERVVALQEQLAVIERLAVERLEGVRREIILMQENAEEAISKATAATERRFESVNEFRAQQADLIKTFATKPDIRALDDKVDDLRNRLEKLATKESVEQAAAQRITRFEATEKRLGIMEQFMSNLQGRMWAMGALIFFGAIILNLVLRFMFEAK